MKLIIMSKNSLLLLVCTCLVSLFSIISVASSEVVESSDFSADAIVIDFDFRPDGSSIPGILVPPFIGSINPDSVIDDEYSSLGVIFSSVDSGPVAVNDPTGQILGISAPNSLIGTSDAANFNTSGPIFATFFNPVSGLPGVTTQVGAFSIDVDIAPVSLIAYDSQGNELERTFFAVGGNGSIDFAGLRREEGIASISINSPKTDALAIDNFTFEPVTVVPEPVSSTLFLVGAATLGFRRFRKNRSKI